MPESDTEFTDYLDFDIQLSGNDSNGYLVKVVRSPAGEALEDFRLPWNDRQQQLENYLLRLQLVLKSPTIHRRIRSPEQQIAEKLGDELFNALLPTNIRSLYDRSEAIADGKGKGLRIRLRIDPPELASIPWEFLYDRRRQEYICLSRNTPVIRYFEIPQAPQPLKIILPLRILGMVASPSDQVPLNVEREKANLEIALSHLRESGQVDLKWLQGQTWRDLQRALRQKDQWHIFHFIGHGMFDAQRDEGVIALSREDGLSELFSATYLARLLADQRSLKFVFLNACEGAMTGDHDIFSSTAATLVQRGIPAVLAMQFGITDKAAIEFSKSLYEGLLADGLPIDAAVSEARKTVSIAIKDGHEWGTPVLYMRSQSGRIFIAHGGPIVSEPSASIDNHIAGTSERERRSWEAGERWKALTHAEQSEDWDEVIKSGERLLLLDSSHQPTRMITTIGYIKRGLRLHDQRELKAAIADFNRAIELNPMSGEAYVHRGNSYASDGNYAQCIEDETKAIALDPQKADYYWRRGNSYTHEDDIHSAIEDYTRAIELQPDNASYYTIRGIQYKRCGEYDAAINDFSKAIELSPTEVDNYLLRASQYQEIDANEQAIDDLSKALALTPNNPAIYARRATIYRSERDLDHAVVDATTAIRLDNEKADYWLLRGNIRVSQEEYSDAIADFTRAIELEPTPENYYRRAVAHKANNLDRAIMDFTKAIELNSKYADAYLDRAKIHFRNANYEFAISDSTKLIELQPFSQHYNLRSLAYSAKRDYDHAIDDLTKAIEIRPANLYYYNRARAYYGKGDYDHAIEDATTAIGLEGSEALDYHVRAMSYRSKMNYDRAIKDETKAIELDPKEAIFYYWRGLAYKEIGEEDQAKEDFLIAADMGHSAAKHELDELGDIDEVSDIPF